MVVDVGRCVVSGWWWTTGGRCESNAQGRFILCGCNGDYSRGSHVRGKLKNVLWKALGEENVKTLTLSAIESQLLCRKHDGKSQFFFLGKKNLATDELRKFITEAI